MFRGAFSFVGELSLATLDYYLVASAASRGHTGEAFVWGLSGFVMLLLACHSAFLLGKDSVRRGHSAK